MTLKHAIGSLAGGILAAMVFTGAAPSVAFAQNAGVRSGTGQVDSAIGAQSREAAKKQAAKKKGQTNRTPSTAKTKPAPKERQTPPGG